MALKPQIQPSSGVIGIPAGLKEAGKRVDFKPDDFALLIETKGYRLAWTRGAQCPCVSVNQQTDQPDPNCDLCQGSGWFYFAPSEAVEAALVGELNDTQQALLSRDPSAIIRGIMSSGQTENSPYDRVVNWVEGEMMLTVRAENKLGYYDKVVNLDSEINYSQLASPDGSGVLDLRYIATGINLIRSITTVYQPEEDYDLVAGEVLWKTGKEPPTGTRLVCHYLMHPTWLIVQHPHVLRTTPVKFKTATPTTPQGDPRPLPIQALVRLDFLRPRDQ